MSSKFHGCANFYPNQKSLKQCFLKFVVVAVTSCSSIGINYQFSFVKYFKNIKSVQTKLAAFAEIDKTFVITVHRWPAEL